MMRTLFLLFVLQTLAFLFVESNELKDLEEKAQELEATFRRIEETFKTLEKTLTELNRISAESRQAVFANHEELEVLEKQLGDLQRSAGGGDCGKNSFGDFIDGLRTLVSKIKTQ